MAQLNALYTNNEQELRGGGAQRAGEWIALLLAVIIVRLMTFSGAVELTPLFAHAPVHWSRAVE